MENWLLQQAYEDNKTVVLFIDEAQSIDSRAFPVLRDLLNLETRERILLQIVLSAQCNIDKKLSYFPALQSRIASVSTLEPLSAEETDAMLLHRFRRAGSADPIRLCPVETMRAISDPSRCAICRAHPGTSCSNSSPRRRCRRSSSFALAMRLASTQANSIAGEAIQ